MRYLLILGAGGSILVQGCVTLNSEYVPPHGGQTAELTIKSAWDAYNQRVIFHGENTCDPKQAKLVGLINAGAIGQKNVKQLDVVVPAGIKVKFSLPQQDLTTFDGISAKFRYCQPVATFVPEAGRSYTLEFSSCSANVFAKGRPEDNDKGKPVQSELDRSCAVATENMGTDGKIFFLMEKNSSQKPGSN